MEARRGWLLAYIWMVFNAFDAVATLLSIRAGYAVEVNPACVWLLAHGVTAFILVKLSLSGVVAWLAWANARGPSWVTAAALWIITVCYGLLAGWHVYLYFWH